MISSDADMIISSDNVLMVSPDGNITTTIIDEKIIMSPSDPKITIIDEYYPNMDSCDDGLIQTTDCNTSTTLTFFQRVTRLDYILVYGALFLVYVVFFLSYGFGVYSPWYATLKQTTVNPWIPRILWVVVTIISYIGLYILWYGGITIERYLGVVVLYLIAAFLTVAWSVSLYQANDIGLAVWTSAILFIFEFYLFIVIWYMNPIAAIFLIPVSAMYLYLVYTMIHLAWLNNVPL